LKNTLRVVKKVSLYFPILGGSGIAIFTRKQACLNNKKTSIATVRRPEPNICHIPDAPSFSLFTTFGGKITIMNYFPLNTFCIVHTDSNPNPFLTIGSRSAANTFQQFSFYELLRVSVCPTSFVSLFPPSASPILPLPSSTSHPPCLYIFRFLHRSLSISLTYIQTPTIYIISG
jgi:hypothetical protein